MNIKLISLYTIMCLIWGSTWLAIKLGIEGVPPFLFAGARFLVASAVLFVILKVQRFPLKLQRGELRPIITLGIFMIAVPYSIVCWGVRYTNSAMGAILMCLLPLLIFPFSILMRSDEKLSWKKLVGVLIGMTGVLVIFYPEIVSVSSSFKGDAALLLSVVIYAFMTVYLKKRAHDIPARRSVFYQMLIATPLLFLASILFERPWLHLDALLMPKGVLSIFYLAVFGSVVTFLIYYWMIKRIGAVASSSAIFLEVGLAVFLDWAVMSVIPGINTWVGIAFIFVGVFIVMVLSRERVEAPGVFEDEACLQCEDS